MKLMLLGKAIELHVIQKGCTEVSCILALVIGEVLNTERRHKKHNQNVVLETTCKKKLKGKRCRPNSMIDGSQFSQKYELREHNNWGCSGIL
jgi:hypothetical protein